MSSPGSASKPFGTSRVNITTSKAKYCCARGRILDGGCQQSREKNSLYTTRYRLSAIKRNQIVATVHHSVSFFVTTVSSYICVVKYYILQARQQFVWKKSARVQSSTAGKSNEFVKSDYSGSPVGHLNKSTVGSYYYALMRSRFVFVGKIKSLPWFSVASDKFISLRCWSNLLDLTGLQDAITITTNC